MHSDETLARLHNVNRIMAQRDRNGGVAIGAHGTSATRAAQILVVGFEDCVPERGGFQDQRGVYFWDEEYANNAFMPGRQRAQEDGDDSFAVILARLCRPSPDYVRYRPQWRALARDVTITEVRYYDLSSGKMRQRIVLE